jgi:hypothetical protein
MLSFVPVDPQDSTLVVLNGLRTENVDTGTAILEVIAV